MSASFDKRGAKIQNNQPWPPSPPSPHIVTPSPFQFTQLNTTEDYHNSTVQILAPTSIELTLTERATGDELILREFFEFATPKILSVISSLELHFNFHPPHSYGTLEAIVNSFFDKGEENEY